MTDDKPISGQKKAGANALASLVANRKAAGGGPAGRAYGGGRESERAAAARSASKSKPAMRK